MKKLSVIIPCYNESKTIRELLNQAIGASIGSWGKEIIVIDDGSSDGTKDILKEYEERIRVIYQEKNGGKGTAVSTGLKEATGDYVLIQDADLEYDPNDITKLLTKIDVSEADVVYGSRTLQQKKPTGRLIPRLGVWFITQLINTFYRLKLTDVWTCYKLFPRAAAGDFVAGGFESELLFTAALARRKYRFAEVPISYYPREISEGKKIRYRDGVYAIIAIVLDWFRNLI